MARASAPGLAEAEQSVVFFEDLHRAMRIQEDPRVHCHAAPGGDYGRASLHSFLDDEIVVSAGYLGRRIAEPGEKVFRVSRAMREQVDLEQSSESHAFGEANLLADRRIVGLAIGGARVQSNEHDQSAASRFRLPSSSQQPTIVAGDLGAALGVVRVAHASSVPGRTFHVRSATDSTGS